MTDVEHEEVSEESWLVMLAACIRPQLFSLPKLSLPHNLIASKNGVGNKQETTLGKRLSATGKHVQCITLAFF